MLRSSCVVGKLLLFGLVAAWAPTSLYAQKAAPADPMDWPFWRGPELNGVSRETGLVDGWTPDGENLLWKREDVGGRSTPIVLRGKLYTLVRHMPGTKYDGEKVICLDAVTGQTKWENIFNLYLTDVPAERIGWSSVVGDQKRATSTRSAYAAFSSASTAKRARRFGRIL